MATIDERLAFLLQSTESLHASTQELHASMQELRATVSELGNAQTETQELTQSVEILSGAQLITERRMGQLTESMNSLSLVMKAIAQAHLEHEDSIARLALIADNHDNRISDLEGK